MSNEELQKEILEGGLILDENTISPDDYILGGDSELSKKIENIKPDSPKHFYNQAAQRRTRNGCTNYAAFGCISDMNGYKFSLEEILEIHDLAEKKYGWLESEGNWLYKAVDCVRDYWNAKFPNEKLITFRVDLLTDEAQRLFEEGKTIMIGYRTSKEHYQDSQDDGILESDSFRQAKKIGGHAIRKNKDDNIDNYIGVKKFNTYENKKLRDYVKEGTYFRYGYVFFEAEESIFPDVPKNHPFYEATKNLFEKGIVKGYDDGTMRLGNNLTRGEFFAVLNRMMKK